MMNTARHLALLAAALLPGAALAVAPPGGGDTVPIGLRILFVAVDRNADGKIDQGEADQFVDRLFAQADSNADGVLSLKEVTAMQATLAPGPPMPRRSRRPSGGPTATATAWSTGGRRTRPRSAISPSSMPTATVPSACPTWPAGT
ncbi:hypothetical protein D3874_12500 [Oleomonas cavernae]|uniref:EF-hand domain-containing protein n=1 Tax=Oleomonas cavernae TaxID=2320859 RepID=A0A418WCI4_9PROT|nr:hypothetical protein [Oleomonas cavernae]RJF87742.1 hypothetical protein D3874_12500 [Oleomonas cavernae]